MLAKTYQTTQTTSGEDARVVLYAPVLTTNCL